MKNKILSKLPKLSTIHINGSYTDHKTPHGKNNYLTAKHI